MYRVLVRLQCSGRGDADSARHMEPEEEVAKDIAGSHLVLGRVSVDRSTRWSQLSSTLGHAFTSYLQTLCGEPATAREEAHRSPLGLGPWSISSILIGEEETRALLLPCPLTPSYLS